MRTLPTIWRSGAPSPSSASSPRTGAAATSDRAARSSRRLLRVSVPGAYGRDGRAARRARLGMLVGMAGELAIRLRGVVKRYGSITAVNGLDLDVPEGTCVGLLGPNGAGKSTTMRLLTAQAIADEGELEVLGLPAARRSRRSPARSAASLPQLDNLDVTLTVEQNLLVFTYLYRIGRAERREAIERALEIANLVDRRDTRVDKLSGGMRRRLLIARALVHRPRLVLLDEPTVGLDPQVRQELWALIDALRAEGTTILMSTHYIEEAERLADTVLIMSHGSAVASGPPSRLDRTSTPAGRRSRSTARPRGSPRSSRRPARPAAHPAHRHQRRHPRRRARRRSRAGGRAPACQPRGRLRPAHRRGDRLMSVAPAPPARRLGRLERPALDRRAGARDRQLLVVLAVDDVLLDRRADHLPAGVRLRLRRAASRASPATTTWSSSAPGRSRPPCSSRARSRPCSGRSSSTSSSAPTTRSSPAPVDTEELVTAEALLDRDARRGLRLRAAARRASSSASIRRGGCSPSPSSPSSPASAGRASASAIAGFASSIENFSYVISAVLTPLFLVAGTFFPLSELPRWAQIAGDLNPLHWCVELVRHAAFGFEGWIDLVLVGGTRRLRARRCGGSRSTR